MKNSNIIILSALIILILGSCRKGEDDPFFSLLSRTNRIEGIWKLEQGNMNISMTVDETVSNASFSMTEDSMTTITQNQTSTEQYIENIEFKKDGSFSLSTSQFYDYGYVLESSLNGTWEFLDNDGDYKNKERIKLTPTNHTLTNGPDDITSIDLTNLTYIYILYITRLSNNDLVFDYEYNFISGPAFFEAYGSKTYNKD